ncbi:hypothetical protein CVT25_002998 [Psilocybe cyanescens]|uniref:DUF659 domain-containing protein n=1 Tax=Psilocybe cyanescens TaxID=93625 RepID=A0A409WN46_PSICY|nr:hypothetical protein CVT25_002998 [Psilocybe cyanescens]
MTDQCALDSSGNLKNASDILFYESESDEHPIHKPAAATNVISNHAQGRGYHTKKTQKLLDSLLTEQLDDDGQPKVIKLAGYSNKHNNKKCQKRTNDKIHPSDEDDGNFSGSDISTNQLSDSEVEAMPSNQEIADSLLSKTIPNTGHHSGKHKRTKAAIKIEIAEDDNSMENISSCNVTPSSSFIIEDTRDEHEGKGKKQAPTHNPIYYFYEKIWHGADGMERVNKPVTQEEINIASGKTPLEPDAVTEFIAELENNTENIKRAFAKQKQQALGEWDQTKFEQLLTNWIIACDQPFEEVEQVEFQELLEYMHHSSDAFKIPGQNVIKQKVMKLSENGIQETKKMFAELEGKVSISLDAWTSPNNIAFLGIVAHYTNEAGELEELLIDFCELMGEHSGKNMAEAIMAFMLDNASNNDTFVDGIKIRCDKAGIQFNPVWACLWCMPHTIHLAALKLLEAIGAISGQDGKKASSHSGNYQEIVTMPLSSASEDLAVSQDDDKEDSDRADDDYILSSVTKVCFSLPFIRPTNN